MITIRASSLPQFSDCARRQAAKSWPELVKAAGHELRKIGTSIGACVGTACHDAIAAAAIEQLNGRPMPTIGTIRDLAEQSLLRSIEKGVIWDATTQTLDVAIHQAASMADMAITRVLVNTQIVDIETRLSAWLDADAKIELTLSGSRDMLERIYEDHHGLIDWKTGTVRRANKLQYGCYALLSRNAGRPIARIREYYLKRVGRSKAQPEPVIVEYDVADAEATAKIELRRVAQTLLSFQKTGLPHEWQANPNSMMCGQNYCPAHGTSWCREHKGA